MSLVTNLLGLIFRQSPVESQFHQTSIRNIKVAIVDKDSAVELKNCLLPLEKDIIAHWGDSQTIKQISDATLQSQIEGFFQQGGKYLIAFKGKKPVATTLFFVNENKLSTHSTFTTPKYRQRGLATLLTEELISYATKHDLIVERPTISSPHMIKIMRRLQRDSPHRVVVEGNDTSGRAVIYPVKPKTKQIRRTKIA